MSKTDGFYYDKASSKFRVDFQIGTWRSPRPRFATRAEAQAAVKEFRDAYKNGNLESIEGARTRSTGEHPQTLGELLLKAKQPVWKGTQHGRYAAAQVERIIREAHRMKGGQKVPFGDPKLSTITTTWFDDLIQWLWTLDISPKTINRYCSAVSALLTYANEDGRDWIAKMPHIDWEDEDEGRIRVLTDAEEKTLLKLLRKNGRHEVAALIEVLIDTGCRRGEMLKVEKGQVVGNKLTLWSFQTKTKTKRVITLTPRAKANLAKYLPWSVSGTVIRDAWQTAREEMGLLDDKEFVPYCCRHTCATRLLLGNGPDDPPLDLRTVQIWMGHASSATTEKYTHPGEKEMNAAAAKLARRTAAAAEDTADTRAA